MLETNTSKTHLNTVGLHRERQKRKPRLGDGVKERGKHVKVALALRLVLT